MKERSNKENKERTTKRKTRKGQYEVRRKTRQEGTEKKEEVNRVRKE